MKEITVRDIDIVTAEINTIKSQTRRVVLTSAIEIGRRLVEAKAMLPHGEWGKWLESSVDYSQSTANNLMTIFREYGDDQTSLFESMDKSETFGKLTYTQALALLAVPVPEREAFVRDNHVEELSTRELKELIRQKDEAEHDRREAVAAQAEAEAAAQELQDSLQEAGSTICNLTAQASAAKREAEEQVQAAKAEAAAAVREAERLSDRHREAKAELQRLRDQLQEARNNPQVPASMMEQLRTEAETKAAEKAAAAADKELQKAQLLAEEAKARAEMAEDKAKAYQAKLEAVQKGYAMQDPDIAVFQEIFVDVQKDFQRLQKIRMEVASRDTGKAASLRTATVAVLEKFLKETKSEYISGTQRRICRKESAHDSVN